MAEPVTNAKIEDVLSSIRRLVSEDNRPESGTERAAETPAQGRGDDADKTDRLVLTPALRVHQTAAAPQAGDTPLPDTAAAEEGVATAPWSDPEATLFSATSDGVDHAEAEAAASELPEAPTDDVAEQEETLTFHSTRAESLSAKIEALEAVIGQTRDQWEPDGTGGDSYSGTRVHPIGWSEAEEATPDDVGDSAAEDVDIEEVLDEAPTEDRAAEDLAADEAVIDEESLRELVAEIVRQELQGALGERITRNVRKLVRREIHRALAAQDLE